MILHVDFKKINSFLSFYSLFSHLKIHIRWQGWFCNHAAKLFLREGEVANSLKQTYIEKRAHVKQTGERKEGVKNWEFWTNVLFKCPHQKFSFMVSLHLYFI